MTIYPHIESYICQYRPDDAAKHRDDVKWRYWLDAHTSHDHYNTEGRARDAAAEYTREMAKWLKANGLKTINYWPTTPGTFQIDDVHQLFIRYRKTHGQIVPTRLTLGRFEDEQCGSWGWSISYTRRFYETHTEAEREAIYRRDSDWTWREQWSKGNRYMPGGFRPDLDIQIVDKPSWAELLS